jgi:hypothetical protein
MDEDEDELAFLIESFEDEELDRLEQKLGGSREWDDEKPTT